MSAISERKTLSIKGKPGMWSAPSTKEVIENKLKETIKGLFDDYVNNYPVSPSYNEIFRWNNRIMDNMATAIAEAYKELTTSLRFKNQAPKTFETIAEELKEYLKKEANEDFAHKFREAYENFSNPKQSLPRVVLS